MAEARTIDLGAERSLHAVQGGKGPDLLLIHGALATHGDWLEGPFDAFARRFRVTAVDRPGHGASSRPRFSGTPRDQARQIAEGLDRLGVGRTIVVGHSMGGLVALALAERFPERVAALVLVAPIRFRRRGRWSTGCWRRAPRPSSARCCRRSARPRSTAPCSRPRSG
jgi:pimeloyl-ACP methyl ester carboxylesterase